MKLLFKKLSVITILVFFAGCASAPTTSGYLSNYSNLQAGEYLEKIWVDKNKVQKTDTVSILMGDVTTDKIGDKKGVTVQDAVSWLQSALEKEKVVLKKHQAALLRLDLAITFMDPGSASGRFLAGELGAGHAQLQIEGKVINIADGALIVAFAERRRSSGAIGLKDIGGDSGPNLVQAMTQDVSSDISRELLKIFSNR